VKHIVRSPGGAQVHQMAKSVIGTPRGANRMKISEAEVRYVAKLARVQIDQSKIYAMSAQLSDILSYMDKLNAVDTSQVPPTAHVIEMATVFREDEVTPSLSQDEALQNAPDRVGAFYRVPKIIE